MPRWTIGLSRLLRLAGALLTPAQQAEFDVLVMYYERRRREEIVLPVSSNPR